MLVDQRHCQHISIPKFYAKLSSTVLQAEGHLHEAVQGIVTYVKGGFSALQYGAIDYLPCYAAAGLLVKLGMFNSSGAVCLCDALAIHNM